MENMTTPNGSLHPKNITAFMTVIRYLILLYYDRFKAPSDLSCRSLGTGTQPGQAGQAGAAYLTIATFLSQFWLEMPKSFLWVKNNDIQRKDHRISRFFAS